MSDPLDRLTEFGSSFEGGTMPKSAAEVRARGDQIRRRRHGLLAGGTALAVAVAVPVLALGGGDGAERIDPAPRPDKATTPLSTADLMRDTDTAYHSDAGWATTRTTPGDGQAVANVCQQESLGGLGATAVFQRDFHWVDEGLESYDGPAASYQPQNTFNESIAEFASADEAQAAYDSYARWLLDCAPPGSDRYDAGEPQDVDPGVEGEALTVVAFYGPVPRSIDRYGDASYILETGLVVTGSRLAVLSQTIVGQDYNWMPDQSTPVARMIPNAAERLLPDVPVDTDLTDAHLPTSEDAVFFSGSDWVEDATSAGEGDLANPCLEQPPSAYGAEETWRRDFRLEPAIGPDDALVATVSEFPTPADARAAYRAAQDDVEDCAQSVAGAEDGTFADEGAFTADLEAVGGEGTVLTATYVPEGAEGYRTFLDTGLAVVGSRLLVLTQQFGGQDYLPEPTTLLTLESAAPRLSDGQPAAPDSGTSDGGTSDSGGSGDPSGDEPPTGGPDLDLPARTTEVPADFPLDAGRDARGLAVELIGPDRSETGVYSTTICGDDIAAIPRVIELSHLGYREVYEGEGSHQRRVTVYPTVQDAVDEMARLRAQLDGCERDTAYESTEERVWDVYRPGTGYDEVTFSSLGVGGPPYGTAYSVVRVGNAILAVAETGEYAPETIRGALPNLAAAVESVAPEMQCVFGAEGC